MEQQQAVGGERGLQLASADNDPVPGIEDDKVVESKTDSTGIAEPDEVEVADRDVAARQLALDAIDQNRLDGVDIQRSISQPDAQKDDHQNDPAKHEQTRAASYRFEQRLEGIGGGNGSLLGQVRT